MLTQGFCVHIDLSHTRVLRSIDHSLARGQHSGLSVVIKGMVLPHQNRRDAQAKQVLHFAARQLNGLKHSGCPAGEIVLRPKKPLA